MAMIGTVKEGACALNMSAELKPDLQLEIAHLLLIDVVDYSRLLVNEQIELMQQLNQIVRSTECFQVAEKNGKLIRVPTGDGMALVFFRSPENSDTEKGGNKSPVPRFGQSAPPSGRSGHSSLLCFYQL